MTNENDHLRVDLARVQGALEANTGIDRDTSTVTAINSLIWLHAEAAADRDRLWEHVVECHELQNNVAYVLGVETDWDAAGRKAVLDAACRLTGNLADTHQVRHAVEVAMTRDLDTLLWLHAEKVAELAKARDLVSTLRQDNKHLYRALGLPEDVDHDDAIQHAEALLLAIDWLRRKIGPIPAASVRGTNRSFGDTDYMIPCWLCGDSTHSSSGHEQANYDRNVRVMQTSLAVSPASTEQCEVLRKQPAWVCPICYPVGDTEGGES